jgi:DDE superfamily endonuclease/Helix-turn-helix of DDE superfamily endonuclease
VSVPWTRAAARNDRDVSSRWARAALSHRIFTGIRGRALGKLIAELAGPWAAAEEARLRERRDHERLRAAGAGPGHGLVFADRVIVTLVYLRFQLPHAALAELYRVDRSTISRAVGEIRPLLAARGFAVPGEPGTRLRTLADVFAYAAARGVTLRLDGTEVQVRRPRAGKPGRRAFVSGKKKQNTKKAAVITDEKGSTLWAGAFRPGRMHDQTAVRTEGIADLFTRYSQVKAKVDAGYRGLAKEFPDQVQAPPLKPKKNTTAEETAAYETQRHQQSSERICVEHANAEHKQWRSLQRYLGRREDFDETYLAIAGLVSDRAAGR